MNYNRTIKGDTKDNTEGNDVLQKYKQKKNSKLLQSTAFWVGTLQKKKEKITKLRID